MATRHGARVSQVRPRPPSNGRPQPVKARPRSPAQSRLAPHRRVERGSGLPLAARLLLVLSVVALCAAVLFAATGGLGRVVSSVGTVFSGAIARITTTTTPPPSPLPEIGAPTLVAPAEAYTNQPTVDLSGSVPRAVVGQKNVRLRLYLALKGQAPAPIKEVPAPATTQFTIPGVELTKGTNDFTITVVGPGGESEPSPVVTYVLDTSVPKITLTAPKDGATINRPAVTMTGKTQARSAVVAHNDDNNATATTEAEADGTFSLPIALAAGVNHLQLTATDPAGNAGQLVLSVRRGAGKLSVSISASSYRFSARTLPTEISLRAVVTDPDGQPLEAVTMTFTLSVPGVQTISADVATDASGVAMFATQIPKGATAGLTGPATASITTPEFGQASDRTTITITK